MPLVGPEHKVVVLAFLHLHTPFNECALGTLQIQNLTTGSQLEDQQVSIHENTLSLRNHQQVMSPEKCWKLLTRGVHPWGSGSKQAVNRSHMTSFQKLVVP